MTRPSVPADPGGLDFKPQQGIGLLIQFSWKPGGVLADLTSWTAAAYVRADYGIDPVIVLSTANGHIQVLDDSGPYNVIITMEDWETAALEDWGRGLWDLKLTPPVGRSWRLVMGYAFLNRSITP